MRIVETTQTDGAARRLVGVVACVHISRDRPDQPCCAGAGLKPAPASASSRRGVGGRASLRVPRWGLACGGRLVKRAGTTSPWAVLLVRARAGLKPAPTPASLGRGVGGRASLRVRRWGLVGGGWPVRRAGGIALGCSAGAGAGGFETRPYVCLPGPRRGGPGVFPGLGKKGRTFISNGVAGRAVASEFVSRANGRLV